MTRLLQAMAGAPHGGAEAFFERLAIALARAGRDAAPRHPPRRRRAQRGCARRVATWSRLPFGGTFDFAHPAEPAPASSPTSRRASC